MKLAARWGPGARGATGSCCSSGAAVFRSMTSRWPGQAEDTALSQEAAFPLDDLTLLCGKKGRC